MRLPVITDKKILKEQQELLDKYMSEAPDDMDLIDYLNSNGSEYFRKFHQERNKNLGEAE